MLILRHKLHNEITKSCTPSVLVANLYQSRWNETTELVSIALASITLVASDLRQAFTF